MLVLISRKAAKTLSTALRKIVAFFNAEGRRGSAEERRVFVNLIRYKFVQCCTKDLFAALHLCVSLSCLFWILDFGFWFIVNGS